MRLKQSADGAFPAECQQTLNGLAVLEQHHCGQALRITKLRQAACFIAFTLGQQQFAENSSVIFSPSIGISALQVCAPFGPENPTAPAYGRILQHVADPKVSFGTSKR